MTANLGRTQVLVYGAVAEALLLIGVRALGAESGGATSYASDGPSSFSSSSSSDGGGSSIALGGGQDVVVDVTGAVRRPGVYWLPAGARVTDAVQRAGGPGGEAALESINLAARLSDGQQVLVPGAAAFPGAGEVESGPEDGPISLGSATVAQLETIDGIGPVTAQDIVDYRDEHGGLSSVDQLDEVSGIGSATMESLRARLQP